MSILDEEDGPLVFERSCTLGLEGIVSKRRDSPYSFRALPGTVRVRTMIKISAILVLLAALVSVGTADPIAPGAIEVIDGDTIRAQGRTVRLVGFDAPESGMRARCESERALAAKATFRLRQLVSSGGLDLELIPCSCRRGTEGTPHCNYGRACGVLTAARKDVGDILISEGLARRYSCGRTSCPHRESWCN
jgi:endonuclease YncB( thermonuclease family)